MPRRAPIAFAVGLLLTAGAPRATAADTGAEPAPPRSQARAAAEDADNAGLLDDSFPIEVAIMAHVGLLHWLDSLTGMNGKGQTAGKSVEAHRDEFNKRLGKPTAEDQREMLHYVEARSAAATTNNAGDPDALNIAFFQAASTREALDALPALLDPKTAGELRDVLQYFAPKYQRVWRGGHIAHEFVQRVHQDERRKAVAGFLVDVARFFGVNPGAGLPPRVQLVPVIDGYGTHAQTIGRDLLIEVRPWDGLSKQLGPLVHETSHMLFLRIDPERAAALERAALSVEHGKEAWDALREALPTALGQGVACQRFDASDWSTRVPWYDLEDVDAYAKGLFELVKTTLTAGGTFDEEFVRKAVALYKGHLPEDAGR